MNKNFIKELNKETTYLEFRILTYLECEEKIKKITQIINFLKEHNFLIDLSLLYYNVMRSENIPEQQNIPSLTIDMRDDKFRFKYWDGSKTYWTYHIEDLTKSLLDGREEFSKLTNKCQPITDLLSQIRKNNDEIKMIRYHYYPTSDLDVRYEVLFFKDVNNNTADLIMKDIFTKVNDIVEDLKLEIDYSFEKECLPCQKAKEKQK